MGLLSGLVKAVTGGGSSSGGSSSNTTTADQTGASESGVVASGGAAVVQDQAVSLGGANSKNIIGLDTSGNNNSQITVGYDAEQFQSALQTVGSNLSGALKTQAAAGNDTLDKVLSQLSSLAESKQTEGVSGLSKTALWGVGIVAVAVLVWALNRK